jgi:exodeoxyribonuclease-5
VTYGVADAIARGEGGVAEVVIDLKSDVAPSAETIAHYRDQVGDYLRATGAQLGRSHPPSAAVWLRLAGADQLVT